MAQSSKMNDQPISPIISPLRDIQYDYDRYDLSPGAQETLKKHAD